MPSNNYAGSGVYLQRAPDTDWLSSIVDVNRLNGMLSNAIGAMDALMTGTQARVYVDQNGERVEFSTSNKDNLRSYIVAIQGRIYNIQHPAPYIRGPMRVLF